MTDNDYMRLMRRRRLERFLNRRLWFTRRQSERISDYLIKLLTLTNR